MADAPGEGDGDRPPGGLRRLLPEGSTAADLAEVLSRPATLDRYVIPVALFGVAWLVYAWLSNGRPSALDYYLPLADAILHGRLGLTEAPSWLNELVPAANGLFYVVYPPAPAILLVPVAWVFGTGLPQVWPSVLLGAANVALVSIVIARMGVPRGMRVVLSLVFGFGTVVWYSAQAGSAWHFAHVVATSFMLLAIIACQRDARTWIIGLLFAGAALSRLPLLVAAPFFLAYLADRAAREPSGDRTPFGAVGPLPVPAWRARFDARRFVRLALPMAIGAGIPLVGYLAYNDLRFGSPLENGYALIPYIATEGQYEHGFFSIDYVPRMLYAMLLTTPVQVPGFPWVQSRLLGGLSIFLTTPLFLWAIKARRPDWFGIGSWLAIALVLVPILTHGDPGGAQFGFRYAQDVYPFLFMLTVRGLGGRIGFEAWLAIALGFVVNAWGMGSTYFDWWA